MILRAMRSIQCHSAGCSSELTDDDVDAANAMERLIFRITGRDRPEDQHAL